MLLSILRKSDRDNSCNVIGNTACKKVTIPFVVGTYHYTGKYEMTLTKTSNHIHKGKESQQQIYVRQNIRNLLRNLKQIIVFILRFVHWMETRQTVVRVQTQSQLASERFVVPGSVVPCS